MAPRSPRPAVLLLVIGVLTVALVAGAALWLRPDADAPTEAAPAVAESLAATPAATVSVQSGALPSAAAAVRPTRLRIPVIGVDADVRPVALEPGTDEMQVPKAIDIVGWYRYGPDLTAITGSMVIAGHVDDAEQGLGAFYRLKDLRPGQRFTVTGGDGRDRTFRAVSREVFSKTAVPLGRLFARDGAPRLTLMTCGGSFDRAAHSYRDNIVVTAVQEGAR